MRAAKVCNLAVRSGPIPSLPVWRSNRHGKIPVTVDHVAFVSEAPLHPLTPDVGFESDLISIPNHQNAITSFEYIRTHLVGATENRKDKGRFEIEKRIFVSKHFYKDFIHALTCLSKHETNIHPLAFLIEALVYKANPELAYDEIV